MLLFSCPNLFLWICGGCQERLTVVIEKMGLGIESNYSIKQAITFNFSIKRLSHCDYFLPEDNQCQESRTSLTLKSGWRKRIFPIPR